MPEIVTVNLATLPDRADLLYRTLRSLAGQADLFRIYLDGHTTIPHVPDEVAGRTVFMRARDDDRWRGDAGKFYWVEHDSGYHFSCDDDLIYPDDYVRRMCDAIEHYGRRAVIGVLGTRYHRPFNSYYLIPTHVGEELLKVGVAHGLTEDWPCHGLGTGGLAYHTSTLRLRRDDFALPNMADVWFARVAHDQNVPCIAIARPRDWLVTMTPPKGTTIWEQWLERRDDQRQTKLIREVRHWAKLPPSSRRLAIH